MDTAKDQSRNVLDDDVNWPAGKGALRSGKFLSRQRADWQQGIAGPGGTTKKEGREASENCR